MLLQYKGLPTVQLPQQEVYFTHTSPYASKDASECGAVLDSTVLGNSMPVSHQTAQSAAHTSQHEQPYSLQLRSPVRIPIPAVVNLAHKTLILFADKIKLCQSLLHKSRCCIGW